MGWQEVTYRPSCFNPQTSSVTEGYGPKSSSAQKLALRRVQWYATQKMRHALVCQSYKALLYGGEQTSTVKKGPQPLNDWKNCIMLKCGTSFANL